MPTLRNISPYGDLEIPLINQVVAGGEEFQVRPEHAEILLQQPENYELVEPKKPSKRSEVSE